MSQRFAFIDDDSSFILSYCAFMAANTGVLCTNFAVLDFACWMFETSSRQWMWRQISA